MEPERKTPTALDHEVLDHAERRRADARPLPSDTSLTPHSRVECQYQPVELGALVTEALFAGAEGPEVFHGFRDRLSEQTDDHFAELVVAPVRYVLNERLERDESPPCRPA